MTRINSLIQNPLRFGDYLAGLIDGEGYFSLLTFQHKGTIKMRAGLYIGLRKDDLPLLEKIQKFLGCGYIWTDKRENKKYNSPNAKPMARLIIVDLNDLINKIVPFLDLHPLLGKKAKDFNIWKDGVKLLHDIRSRPRKGLPGIRSGGAYKWTPKEYSAFCNLVIKIKEGRRFLD